MTAIYSIDETQWSSEAVASRYTRYCNEMGIAPAEVNAKAPIVGAEPKTGSESTWPIMEEMIKGIERGDEACKMIGVEYLESDLDLPFGKILKSMTARALRHTELSENAKLRIRKRIVNILLGGKFTSEFKQYTRLLKSIGFDNLREEIENRIDRKNQYAMKHYHYLIS